MQFMWGAKLRPGCLHSLQIMAADLEASLGVPHHEWPGLHFFKEVVDASEAGGL